MAPKAKKAETPAVDDEDVGSPATDDGEAEMTTTLTAVDHAFLQRVSRFLVNVPSAKYLKRAKREGYSSAEHKKGWMLWSQASGMTRPLAHWFGEQESQGTEIAADRLGLLRELDEFENKWFPRARAIIRRQVTRDSRDGFATAFFKDLAQQPLGPGVVGSVRMFLNRVEELEKSKEPGAKEVLRTLRERGLTLCANVG